VKYKFYPRGVAPLLVVLVEGRYSYRPGKYKDFSKQSTYEYNMIKMSIGKRAWTYGC
jgi:hypothetical protein